jgi:hypothetical protein
MKSTSPPNRASSPTSGSVPSKAKAKAQSKPPAVSAGSIDETSEWTDRKATSQALRAAQARQVSGRRRFVDPTTCEREYTVAEMEFMQAMQEYKASSGRMFPTWSEVLEVLQGLGYEKQASPGEIPNAPGTPPPKRVAATSTDTPCRRVASVG